jgi:class 3 adenylate cyclase
MAGLLAHAVAYAAVNGFLVANWVLTSGSSEELRQVLDRPEDAIDLQFWPIWCILGWGTGLAIHAGVVLVGLPSRVLRALRGTSLPRPIPVRATPPVVHDAATRRRWVVVMFVDICDSTARNERLGDEAWHALLRRYRDVVRRATAARRGTEVGTGGDGVLVRFESPSDGVLCAIDIQRALEDGRALDPEVPHARIGLHAGDVVEDEGDVVGRVVNLASRVSSAAEAGEILVTEPVADQLIGSLRLEDKGLQPLRGVTQHRHLLAVHWSEAAATGV